jgi:hypothetical protein
MVRVGLGPQCSEVAASPIKAGGQALTGIARVGLAAADGAFDDTYSLSVVFEPAREPVRQDAPVTVPV